MNDESNVQAIPSSSGRIGGLSECNDNLEEDYKRLRMEVLREYPIRISFASLGCMIEVGCKSVAFSTIKEGMEALIDFAFLVKRII